MSYVGPPRTTAWVEDSGSRDCFRVCSGEGICSRETENEEDRINAWQTSVSSHGQEEENLATQLASTKGKGMPVSHCQKAYGWGSKWGAKPTSQSAANYYHSSLQKVKVICVWHHLSPSHRKSLINAGKILLP